MSTSHNNYNDNHWILVEDDEVDQDLFKMAFKKAGIKNELIIQNNGEEALKYILENKKAPFVIIADINMPLMNGLELLKAVKSEKMNQFKSIPFLIYSSSISEVEISLAYKGGAQGYFSKFTSIEEQVDLIVHIQEYWSRCRHPAYFLEAALPG
jgi:CheY-like chemotaxis protein